MTAGERIKLFRLLNGFTQSFLAGYLDTKQANIAMIEKGKFQPALRYTASLSSLFFIRQEWLEKGEQPVFHTNVNIFTLPPDPYPYLPKKTRNDIDNTIRELFTAFLQDEKISDIYILRIKLPPEQSGNFNIFIYRSEEFKHLNIFKTKEYKDMQFFEALYYATNKMPVKPKRYEFPLEDALVEYYDFFITDGVSEPSIMGFETILRHIMKLQNSEILDYINGYRYIASRATKIGHVAFSYDAIIAEIVRLIKQYNIPLRDIEESLKKSL